MQQNETINIMLPPNLSKMEEAELKWFLANRSSNELNFYSSKLKTLVLMTALYNMPFIDMVFEAMTCIPKDAKQCIQMYGIRWMRSTFLTPFVRRGEVDTAVNKFLSDVGALAPKEVAPVSSKKTSTLVFGNSEGEY